MIVKLSDIIAPTFFRIHKAIKNNSFDEYMLKGGRGSTKSSFIGIEIIFNMMNDAKKDIFSNAVILRKVKDTLHDSVFEQIAWAIEMLKVDNEWDVPKSKLEITYKPTGQKILFRGADKPKKIKSIKVKKGYIKYIWYEELDEFGGGEEIRSINQSLMRGGDFFSVFYTYNPPKSARSWVNQEAKIPKKNRLVHHSTYLEVNPNWLGKVFIIEAEHLKKNKKNSYDHEYLGEETGTGLEVFNNVTIREITDSEIESFDNFRQGIDFGYAADPVVFERMHFDKKRKKIYFIFEFTGHAVSNRKLFEQIKQFYNSYTIVDSAEPKSIAELEDLGMNIIGAKKGPDSIDFGINYLANTIEEIIIDSVRCPLAAKEFVNYALEVDKNGEVKSKYPDKDNHSLDTTRYAFEDDMKADILPQAYAIKRKKDSRSRYKR